MIIDVDLTGGTDTVTLVEAEDCKRFHVSARGGDPERLARALSASSVGRLLPSGDAVIDTAAVVRLAEGRVGETWTDDFAAMLAYAMSKGWIHDGGAAIQAHVEWSL